MTENSKRTPRFLLLMPEEIREGIESAAQKNKRTLTKEINNRLRISLAAHSDRFQAILAREAFPIQSPGIAPGAPTPTTGPDHQPVKLSDIDMELLRIFHAMPIHKQLALVSLFK